MYRVMRHDYVHNYCDTLCDKNKLTSMPIYERNINLA